MAVIALDFLDEGLIDFDCVNRKTMQIGERRIACPKVIDGYTDSEFAKAGQLFINVLRISDAHIFGDLDLDLLRRNFVTSKCIAHFFQEIAAIEIVR